MKPKFWTKGRIEWLRSRAEAGVSSRKIADELGISKSNVTSVASANKIRFTSIDRRGLTDEDKAEVRRLIKKGHSWEEIATALGRNTENFRKLCNRNGLTVNPQRKKEKNTQRQPRKCLMHGGKFTPSHKYEFVCPSCKATKTWRESQVQLI